MTFIKLTHTTGSDYINLDHIYRIVETAVDEITIYDANSILPISYTFSSAQEQIEVLAKFESIVGIIDIDKLANQR